MQYTKENTNYIEAMQSINRDSKYAQSTTHSCN